MRLALALILASACSSTPPATMTQEIVNQPGKYQHQLTVGGMERELIVYVPEKARGQAHAPVVFMFHGTSGDGEKFYNLSAWKEKADAEGLIAVFPTALVTCYHEDENADGDFDDPGERAVTTKWMAWDPATTKKFEFCSADEIATLPADRRALADHPIADDVAFFDEMVKFLADGYSVDSKRLYVSGFSNGACFTARLAIERSEIIAAAASAAGTLQVPARPAARPLTYAVTIGNQDEKIVAALGVNPIPVQESVFTDVPPLGALMQLNLMVVQLADPPAYAERMVGGQQIAQFTWSTSPIGAANQYTFAVIEGLGHQYPNGKNHPLVMADVLWELFRTQSLP